MKQGNVNKTCYICHKNVQNINYVKSVCIRSYSGPHFPVFGLNTERYRVCGKMWTMITPNTDTCHTAQYCLCGELGRLPRLGRRKVILRPFIVGFYWKFRRVVFCFSWLCQVQLTLFCTVATWRLLLWFTLTRRRRPLIHKYFHSITIAYLNSGITIIVLFSQEKSLRWKK